MGSGLTPAQEGFDFLPASDPYSDGVVARSGYEIVHAVVGTRPPWRQGFELVARFLERRGRPMAALCAIELRSPTAVGFDGFAELNAAYHDRLRSSGLLVDGVNPLARTNVVPLASVPSEVVLFGFSFSVPTSGSRPTFVTSGAGELREDSLATEAIVAPGDTSPDGLLQKADHVLATMASRLDRLEVGWEDVTATCVYMAADPGVVVDLVHDRIGPAARHGVRWFPSRPPVTGLDFEMDVRGARRELMVDLGDA